MQFKRTTALTTYFLLVLTVFLLSSCIRRMQSVNPVFIPMETSHIADIRKINQGRVLNKMILDVRLDLVRRNPSVKSVVVWWLEAKTAGLDMKLIRRKLIAELVNLNRFTVVYNDSLNGLLARHNLSLSGVIDQESAVEFGHLLGVDGFVGGSAAIQDNRFFLSLNLIKTSSGKTVWSTTVEHDL